MIYSKQFFKDTLQTAKVDSGFFDKQVSELIDGIRYLLTNSYIFAGDSIKYLDLTNDEHSLSIQIVYVDEVSIIEDKYYEYNMTEFAKNMLIGGKDYSFILHLQKLITEFYAGELDDDMVYNFSIK